MPLIAPSSVGAGEQSLLSAAKMKPAFLFPCNLKSDVCVPEAEMF
jgi:hypothetical protein